MNRPRSVDRLIAKCYSWGDFCEALVPLTAKQKGDAFERLTQLYLLTKPEYRTKLKNVWICQTDLPQRVRKSLNLPTTDEGIDLVAETRSGEFWAIQSKFRTDSQKPLTVTELSTFANLTFNTCKGSFVQALVAHTSAKPVRKRKLLPHTTEIGLQRWLETTREDWKLILGLLKQKSVRPKPKIPRPHQKKAISAAKKYFVTEKQRRGKLIMPCGTGKSLTAFWIAHALKAETVLVVVPSLALIKQGVEDWTREIVASRESPLPNWLCVCSDESVGATERDEFVGEVYDLGLPVTTDAAEIRRFLKEPSKGRRVIFVTYQSSPLLAKAARKVGAEFDLAILDEAHKTAGEKSKSFATLLFDKNLSVAKRIYMTATERVVRGSHDEVISMDKESIYGKCFYQLSFKDAIHSKPPIICDYKILTLLVSEDEVRSLIKSRRLVTDRKFALDAEDSRELASAIALRKAYAEHGITHAISFHRSIRAAVSFADQQEKLNKLKRFRPVVESFHISSKESAGERAQLLRDFEESPIALTTNARCLTEGVDVPAIDCVLFADPKHSTIDIVQAAGRALRPYRGKKYGYIMLPIIVPNGMSVEDFAETTEYRNVSRVITALSTQDERIAEEFRIINRGKRPREQIIRIEASISVGSKIDLRQFSEAISAKLWERVGKVNWRTFNEARQFARSLKLQNRSEWSEFVKSGKRPPDIPADPNGPYKDKGWSGMGDWLGTGRIAAHLREYRSFREARKFARSLKLSSVSQWRQFTKSGKLPPDVPASPMKTYKDKGWSGMGDWLGTGRIADHLREYRSFREARKFARSLKLSSVSQWRQFTKSGKRPEDIPATPDQTYKDKGWSGMGDWLGTGNIAPRLREYRSFAKARKFARSLNLSSRSQWRQFTKSGKRPEDIPATPDQTYKDKGWSGMGDWLGTGNIAPRLREYRSFAKARKFARSLNLSSSSQWQQFTKSGKLPADIPANPNQTYENNGWSGMGDWLGTGNIAPRLREYRSFAKARKFARSLNLSSSSQWQQFTKSGKLPADIPATPERTYKDKGWAGMGDWLGTGRIADQLREYRSFREARKFARSLKLSSSKEWKKCVRSGKVPLDIPSDAHTTYKDKGWAGWGDFLGTGNVAFYLRKFRSFAEARDYARSLKLDSANEWNEYAKSGKRPEDIPAAPDKTYKDKGWSGMGDWLGTGNIAPRLREYRSFAKARAFARSLQLQNVTEWRRFTQSGKLPQDIPAAPDRVYENKGWVGYSDWLGTGNIAYRYRTCRSFAKARAFARSLNLSSGAEWRRFTQSGKLPQDIPKKPDYTYKDKGWAGMGDWLGTGNVASKLRQYRSFIKARVFARSLKLSSGAKWREFVKSGKLPKDIPAKPERTYKDKGWAGMGDWLGTGNVANKLRQYRSFIKARVFARSLKLSSGAEWKEYTKSGKLPKDIPADPRGSYKDKGWVGMGDWLGN